MAHSSAVWQQICSGKCYCCSMCDVKSIEKSFSVRLYTSLLIKRNFDGIS